MIIFIDFDDVLFNTKRFKGDLKKLFLKHGIDNELFDKTYSETASSSDNTSSPYNLDKHINRISRFFEINKVNLLSDINLLTASMNKYVFPDAKVFLNSHKDDRVILLSFGSTEFQKRKIDNSGIVGLFQEVIISDGQKSRWINQILTDNYDKKNQSIFIDDRVSFISDVKKNCPMVTTILFDRPEGRYHDKPKKYCDHLAHSFPEVEAIIKKIKK